MLYIILSININDKLSSFQFLLRNLLLFRCQGSRVEHVSINSFKKSNQASYSDRKCVLKFLSVLKKINIFNNFVKVTKIPVLKLEIALFYKHVNKKFKKKSFGKSKCTERKLNATTPPRMPQTNAVSDVSVLSSIFFFLGSRKVACSFVCVIFTSFSNL